MPIPHSPFAIRHVALATVGLVAACVAPQTVATPEPPHQLVVLSYNIHHGEGADGKFDLERLAEVILATDADLVALQEVDVRTARASGIDQAAELGRLTGMHVAFGEAMPYDGGSYGEAILSRWPILVQEVIALPASQDHEPRAAIAVTVQPPGAQTRVRFVGTHLDHTKQDADRLAQTRELLQRLLGSDTPTVLAGDLNAQPDSATMAVLFGEGWRPADPTYAPTYPAQNPDIKIDWHLLSPGSVGKLTDPQILSEPIASDHCPYRAIWVLR
ncbi:MAG: endonuclease/exonuclease/phosphatase family protein [Planctomycetota bacterium]|nr:endonuclease/exonuclease/phosphatase family protein [Planctomycetota bacterium]